MRRTNVTEDSSVNSVGEAIATVSSKPTSRLGRLREGIASGGIDYILSNVSSRLPDHIFYFNHSYFLRGQGLEVEPPGHTKCSYRFGTPHDAARIAQLDMSPVEFLRRLRNGQSIVLCDDGEDLLCYSCATTGKISCQQSGVSLDTGSDGFLLCGVFTRSDRRRRGHFKGCLYHQIRHHQRQGRHQMYAEIERLNRTSVVAHQRLGFRIEGDVVRIGLFGMNIVWYRRWPWGNRRLRFFFRDDAAEGEPV